MAAGTAMAEGYCSARVELKQGDAVEIQLSNGLKTKFSEQYMTFVDGTRIMLKVLRTNVSRITFSEKDAAGIGEVSAPAFEGNGLSFHGLPAGTPITVVNAAGRQVLCQKAEGDFTLDLNQFAPGTYLVSARGVTYKVMIR